MEDWGKFSNRGRLLGGGGGGQNERQTAPRSMISFPFVVPGELIALSERYKPECNYQVEPNFHGLVTGLGVISSVNDSMK